MIILLLTFIVFEYDTDACVLTSMIILAILQANELQYQNEGKPPITAIISDDNTGCTNINWYLADVAQPSCSLVSLWVVEGGWSAGGICSSLRSLCFPPFVSTKASLLY